MNKGDLVDGIARETGLSKQKSAECVESLMKSISFALKNGDNITLSGFGTFSAYQRKARTFRNPQTGALIRAKSRRVARFSAGSELRKAVSRS